MILSLFRRRSNVNEAIVLKIYESIVSAARQKYFYAEFAVPDTPLGRYEMLSLHLFLVMQRLKATEQLGPELAQALIDEFFKDVDHSLRELGIGDQSVPKRMKKLAKMFYGRVTSYDIALDDNDKAALAAALTRNVRPYLEIWDKADNLADYVFVAREGLLSSDNSRLMEGFIEFPDAATIKTDVKV